MRLNAFVLKAIEIKVFHLSNTCFKTETYIKFVSFHIQMWQSKEEKVIIWFLSNPFSSIGIRELARITNRSPAFISRLAKRLLSAKIIKKVDTKIQADTANKEYLALKIAYNYYRVYSSNIIEDLVLAYRPKSIVLFGSFSRGQDHESSDIDLAIVDPQQKGNLNVQGYEKKANRRISIHIVKSKSITGELWDSIINGVVIHGFLEDPHATTV